MKINSTADSNKNAFLIFHENIIPYMPKKNMTKTRNDAKSNLFKFINNDSQEFAFNNTFRTKSKTSFYPSLDSNFPKNNNILNNDQLNFNSFLNKIRNGELPNFGNNSKSRKDGQNINIILYAPNYVLNKMESGNNNGIENGQKNFQTENNICSREDNKGKKKEMDRFPFEEKKCNNVKDAKDCSSKKKKDKKLFDSNFNLLEDELGDDELSQILKEFVHLDLESPKKDSVPSNHKNQKIYTNTGDSINFFTCDGSPRKDVNNTNMTNPYLMDAYKK